MVLYNTW